MLARISPSLVLIFKDLILGIHLANILPGNLQREGHFGSDRDQKLVMQLDVFFSGLRHLRLEQLSWHLIEVRGQGTVLLYV